MKHKNRYLQLMGCFIYKNLHNVLLVFGGVIVFAFSIRHIAGLASLLAWDELGYWGNAAYIAGYDWADMVSTYSGYYSYGYSLILAVLLKIFSDSSVAYQAAIICNGIFLTLSFYLSYYCGISCFGKKNRDKVLFASLVISFYANSITQSNHAWTECFLIFLYWLLTALFISLTRDYKFYKFLLIGLVSIYMYIVHTRTIGIVIASFLVLYALCIFKRGTIWQCVVSVIFFATVVIGVFYLQTELKTSVWNGKSDVELVNTVSYAAPWIFGKMSNIYGIIDIIKAFLLRFFYFGMTTFLMFFVFLKKSVQDIICSIKSRQPKYHLVFLILSMLGIFGVMSLQLSQAGNYQSLLYGRYQDIIVGPLFFMGIMYFLCEKEEKYQTLFHIIIWGSAMYLFCKIARSIPIYTDYYVSNCNVELNRYWIGTWEGGYDLLFPISLAIIGCVIMAVIRYIYKDHKIYGVVALASIWLVFSVNEYYASEAVFEQEFTNYYDMEQFYSQAKDMCDEGEDIYYYNADYGLTTPLAMGLQMEFYDRSIQIVEETDSLKKGSYIFVPCIKENEYEFNPSADIDGEILLSYKYLSLYKID